MEAACATRPTTATEMGRLTFRQAGEGGESGDDRHGRARRTRRRSERRLLSFTDTFCGRGFGVGARETLEEQPRSASEAAASFFVEDSELCHFSLPLPPALHPFAQWVKDENLSRNRGCRHQRQFELALIFGLNQSFDTTCWFHILAEILKSPMGSARIWLLSQD